MRGRLRRGFVIAALVLASPGAQAMAQAPQDAQAAQQSHGSWLGIGLGYGAFRTGCTNCTNSEIYSSGAGLSVDGGIVVNDKLDAGGEIFWSSTAISAGTYRAAFVLGVAQFRPWRTRGFYLKGGLGLAYIRASVTAGGEPVTSTPKGLGVHYGAGWMFGEGRRVSFAPFGGHYMASLGDVPTPTSVAENVVSNVWFAGVTVFVR